MGVFRKVIVAGPKTNISKVIQFYYIDLPQILKYLMAISITDITQEIINTFNPLWHRHNTNRDESKRIKRFKYI